MTPLEPLPLVSCIMPTANRRAFVPQAIRCFLAQDYPNKELLIADDGKDRVADLIPAHPQIRYVTLEGQRSLGTKRNLCVEMSRGNLICHWDDDDWSAPNRLSLQVRAMQEAGAEVCSLRQMLFYEVRSGRAWLYTYPPGRSDWLAGGTLLYTRAFWQRSPFPNIQIGEDTRFIMSRRLHQAVALPDFRFYVALIHAGNTSPKTLSGSYWSLWKGSLPDLMGLDFDFYAHLTAQASARPPQRPAPRPMPPRRPPPRRARPSAPKPPPAAQGSDPLTAERRPTYHILMVAHNALEMLQISILRTLRHSAGQDARLVVVDNASNDGTQTWLDLLARRGDILLLRSAANIGHGPALELARTHLAARGLLAPYLVTLDSDAFPLSDNWLAHLRGLLSGPVQAAGIRHHRNYIHPSCLMLPTQLFDELDVTFLNEKDRPSRLDVAERISVEILRRGGQIAGLARTRDFGRGSASEPVYLGSVYENLVYHHWYTTRSALAGGRGVDDVPLEAITRAWQLLMEQEHEQAREVTVIIGARARPDQPRRLRNLLECLRSLNLQNLERWRYRVVVVEQDQQPHLRNAVAPYVDQYIFARNPGPYNRGWAFNIGAVHPGSRGSALCLLDADLLLPPHFLREGLEALRSGSGALQPYTRVLYLDRPGTDRALADASANRLQRPESYSGRIYDTSQGGCLWVDQALYLAIGGHDERFRGWGSEDREFWQRLARAARIERLPNCLLHLDHEPPSMTDAPAQANYQLLAQIQRGAAGPAPDEVGSLHRYAHEPDRAQTTPVAARPSLTLPTPTESAPPPNGPRDWQNWHTWNPTRIEHIVLEERRRPAASSVRAKLAALLAGLGNRVLDVGCGPGALWIHLERLPELSLLGADITGEMLAAARRFFSTVPVVQADSGWLPFAGGSFDVVLLRHMLEHLPEWLVQRSLNEAARLARRAVVLDFWLPPAARGRRYTRRVGDNFLETRWTTSDIHHFIAKTGYQVQRRLTLDGGLREHDDIWVLTPSPLTAADAYQPLVSIIMPTYRRNHIIRRTVETILAQTYPFWELIIVDNDGGLTETFDDPRIQVYHHAEKASASYARNQGLKYAQGELVCFFDDDDDMFPYYLERFVAAFAGNPKAKMARCGMIVSGGKINYSYATPECCLRRACATPTWTTEGPGQDQKYFQRIVRQNGWDEKRGDIVVIREALCRANTHPVGGLRSGKY